MTMLIIMLAVMGYLLGSIPFGILLTKAFGAGDLRQIGSGSIGATNVLRTGRKGLAVATMLLDGAKGALAVGLAWLIAPQMGAGGAMVAGGAALIGHCYPVWLGFRGGKGAATMFGLGLALYWPIGLIFAAVWLGVVALLRMSSVGSLTAAISVPVSAFALGYPVYGVGLGILAAVIFWRHRENISRLIAGTEPRIGSKKTESDPAA